MKSELREFYVLNICMVICFKEFKRQLNTTWSGSGFIAVYI